MPVKRVIISTSALLIVIAVALGGNYIVASALDARLAPLLTRVLGLPVEIAPIKVHRR